MSAQLPLRTCWVSGRHAGGEGLSGAFTTQRVRGSHRDEAAEPPTGSGSRVSADPLPWTCSAPGPFRTHLSVQIPRCSFAPACVFLSVH